MRRALTLATLAAAGLVLAGCTTVDQDAIAADPFICEVGTDGCDQGLPIGPGGQFSIEAGDLFFQNLVGVPIDGSNEVTIINIGQAEHNIRIDQAAGENKKVNALGGETVTGTLELFAGTYTYYCDIPGHRAAGMEGTITVFEDGEAASVAGADAGQTTDMVEGTTAIDDEVDDEADPADGEEALEDAEASGDEEGAVEPDQVEAEAEAPPTGESAEQTLEREAEEVLAEADGDYSQDTIDALDDSGDVEDALRVKGSARLYQLTFASGSAEIDDQAEVIEQIVAYLTDNPDAELRVEGNSDSTGGADSNQELSEERAEAVVAALVDAGINPDRLSAVGNGEDNLLVDDDADDTVAQAINRRVELFLTR